jgi:hypothetical protein
LEPRGPATNRQTCACREEISSYLLDDDDDNDDDGEKEADAAS